MKPTQTIPKKEAVNGSPATSTPHQRTVELHAAAEASFMSRTRGRVRDQVNFWDLLALPGLAFMAIAFGWPLVEIVLQSLQPSASNFSQVLMDSQFRAAVWRTVRICLLSTAMAALIGYTYAYAMATAGRVLRTILAAMLLLAIWTGLLIRSYAFTLVFSDTGLINRAAINLGLVDHPLPLIRNTFAVTVATTQILLPLVVMPVYLGLRTFDAALVEAAASLGAPRRWVFWRVIFPLTVPSLAAGVTLAFVLSMGFFVVAQLVGSPQTYLVSQNIQQQVSSLFQPHVAAAMAVVLLLLIVVFTALIYIVLRLTKLGELKSLVRSAP